eukprot:4925954-Pleurochrysis_carterae.AAC.2
MRNLDRVVNRQSWKQQSITSQRIEQMIEKNEIPTTTLNTLDLVLHLAETRRTSPQNADKSCIVHSLALPLSLWLKLLIRKCERPVLVQKHN